MVKNSLLLLLLLNLLSLLLLSLFLLLLLNLLFTSSPPPPSCSSSSSSSSPPPSFSSCSCSSSNNIQDQCLIITEIYGVPGMQWLNLHKTYQNKTCLVHLGNILFFNVIYGCCFHPVPALKYTASVYIQNTFNGKCLRFYREKESNQNGPDKTQRVRGLG